MDVRPLETAAGTESSGPLPRTLNLRDAIAIVVGSIIGSGIFMREPDIARTVGSFGPILAVWLVVGVLSWCGALASGELAAMMPQAGGPYVYLRAAYGRLPAFLWGWTEFLVMRTAALGTLACACVIYLEELIPNSSRPSHATEGFFAAGIIIALALVNIRGTRWGANVQNITTILKAGLLVMLIVSPWVMGKANVENLNPISPSALNVDFWRSFAVAMLIVKWPYDGWANLGFIAGEVKNPQRSMPAALTIGMAIIVSLYVLTVLSYHLVLPFQDVVASERIAAEVSNRLFGSVGGVICAIGVTISALGAANSNMLTVPRIYFAVARDGLLPEAISRPHPVYRTPANAIKMQTAWALGLLALVFLWTARSGQGVRDAFTHLSDFVIFGGEIFYGLTIAAVFVLRWKRPDLHRPYRTFGYPFTPALYLVGAIAVLASFFNSVEKIQQMCFGLILIGLGIPYYLWASRTERGRTGTEGVLDSPTSP
jgi:basic amino acid/polyamine antiporter, APA family